MIESLRRAGGTSGRRAATVALALSVGMLWLASPSVAQPAPPAPTPQGAAPATAEKVAGIDKLLAVSPTVSLAGAVPPAAMTALAARGVKTFVSLRVADEQGYDAAATEAAARAAGLQWVAAPFNGEAPDAAAVDKVLAELAKAELGSTVLSCRSGGRAAMMWYAHRVLNGGAEPDTAFAEAESQGLTRAELKTFIQKYVADHRK